MSYLKRKEQRKSHYMKYVYGWKLKDCTACNGSGYYDNTGSPSCGCCDGTGKESYRGVHALLQLTKDERKPYLHLLSDKEMKELELLELDKKQLK